MKTPWLTSGTALFASAVLAMASPVYSQGKGKGNHGGGGGGGGNRGPSMNINRGGGAGGNNFHAVANRDRNILRTDISAKNRDWRPASWDRNFKAGDTSIRRSASSYYRNHDSDRRWRDHDWDRDDWRRRYRHRDWDDNDNYYFSIGLGGLYGGYGTRYGYPYYASYPYYGYGYISPYSYYGYPYSPYSGYSYYTGYSSYYPGYYW